MTKHPPGPLMTLAYSKGATGRIDTVANAANASLTCTKNEYGRRAKRSYKARSSKKLNCANRL